MKRLGVLVGLLVASICAQSQVPTEKTLLWEITGKDTKQPSYLFGTFHIMCSEDLVVPDVVKQKFNSTKELFLEIDMDDPNMMQELMLGMMMKDSASITNLIEPSKLDSTNKAFEKITGFGLEMMKTAKPMLLMSMLYPSILGCTPASWEKIFQDMAAAKKMELKGLEKVSDQIEVFEKIPYKIQADMFTKTILNMDSSKIQFNTLLSTYKSKDIDAMVKMTIADDDYGDYEEILLTNRNQNWIPIISKQAALMPTFFAVGAGHLGGENGVINLLRKAGYKVKPVMYK